MPVTLRPAVFTKFTGIAAAEREECALRTAMQLLDAQAKARRILLQWPSAEQADDEPHDFAICLYNSIAEVDATLGEIALGVRGSFHHVFGITQKRIPKPFRKGRGQLYKGLFIIPPRATKKGLLYEPTPSGLLDRVPLSFHDLRELTKSDRVGEIFQAVALERDWVA